MYPNQNYSQKSKQHVWLSVIIGFSILVSGVLESFYHLPLKFILPFLILGLWIFGSIIMWQRANTKAKKDVWWDDNSCSGWRGY